MKEWQRLIGGGALSVVLLAGVAGQQAIAGPLVQTWSYTINNAFQIFEPTPGVVGLNDNPVLNAPTRLEWPLSGSDRSALEVDSIVSGSDLQTGGAQVAGATLTHENTPVALKYRNQFLTGGRLSVRLELEAADQDTNEAVTIDTHFDFLFKETDNTGNCGFASASNCDDIFVLADSGDLTQEFTYLGETYTVVFGSEELATLDPAACQQLGFGTGCIGFLTPENATTDFLTFLRIIGPAVAVPEPGVLALLGTGLVVLGLFRRRRSA